MARRIYRIDEFLGLDQSRNQNGLASAMSCDACNMDTYDGNLTVAKGYVKHIAQKLPGNGKISNLRLFCGNGTEQVMVVSGKEIYAYKSGAWNKVYEYGEITNGRFDFVQAQINSVDNMIIANGEGQLVKYDGTTASLFGSGAGVSNISVNYLALYKSRLFTAGDPLHPNRLYWSQLPGDARSIEDWSSVPASPNVEGGHTEIGGMGGDPIMAIASLSNQLLIFKKQSLWRFIGDKPGNFIVEELDSHMLGAAHTSLVKLGDVLYFLTPAGMCCFNGVTAAPADGRRLIKTLETACVQDARGALTRDKLYFSIKEGETDAMIEFDTTRRTLMLRRGFGIRDICAWNGELFMINDARYVYRFSDAADYDGTPISAWWQTPVTDTYDKGAIKAMRELYLRGSTDEADSALLVDVCVGKLTQTHRVLLPENQNEVLEVPLKNEGRTFSMRFYNEAGGHFSLEGGVELHYEQWRRVE